MSPKVKSALKVGGLVAGVAFVAQAAAAAGWVIPGVGWVVGKVKSFSSPAPGAAAVK